MDDLRAAYRTVPVASQLLSVVAVWSYRKGRATFYRLPGHAFGLVASVVNFCRLAHFVCHVCHVMMLVAVDHYVDDFCYVDPAYAGNSGHDALRLVLLLLGLDVEMDKRQWAAPSNLFLGVLVSIAQAHHPHGHATAQPTARRVEKVLQFMRAAARLGQLTAAQASKLRGLLGFTLLPVSFRFGRAACQPLAARQHGTDGTRGSTEWSRPLAAMHAFFERTLPRLPPLRVPMSASRARPVLVYTDASFVRSFGRRVATLGLYVLDPVSQAEYWSKLVLPEAFYQFLAPDKRTYIAQAELIAAVAVWFTLPDLLRDRAVMMFIDNVVALSAIVNGYANKADCAALVNCFHEAVLSLRSHLWSEWVPSKANIADFPTRSELEHLVPETALFIPMVLPPIADFADMLSF